MATQKYTHFYLTSLPYCILLEILYREFFQMVFIFVMIEVKINSTNDNDNGYQYIYVFSSDYKAMLSPMHNTNLEGHCGTSNQCEIHRQRSTMVGLYLELPGSQLHTTPSTLNGQITLLLILLPSNYILLIVFCHFLASSCFCPFLVLVFMCTL